MSGQAIPHTKYSQHLQRCLSSRFCHASGLTPEQAQQPDLLQQGIALLVSALESGPKAAATAQQRKTADHAPHAGSAKAGSAAAGDEGVRGEDPICQHASTATGHISIGTACERSNLFRVSISHPGIHLASDLAEDAALAGDAQQAHLEGGSPGTSSDVSMSLSGSLHLTGAAEEQPEQCSLPFNCFGRNSLGKGIGSAPSPSISEECEAWDMEASLHSPARGLLDLPLADEIKVPSMGLCGGFEDSLASRSPQLANAFQQQTADIHSPVTASISLYELSAPEGDHEQDLARPFDEDLAFLEEGSSVRHEELFATDCSDMQTLRRTEQFNKRGIAQGRIDEDLPNCNGLELADAEQAVGKDPLQDLGDAELDTDLLDNSRRMRDTQVWYKVPSSTAMTYVADPDPVAAFSGFCDSLAV